MIQETIARIEAQIRSSQSLTIERRKELIALVAELKQEVEALASTHAEDAQSIAGFTESSVREATRSTVNPALLHNSMEGLSLSVERFEVSHPTLVGIINAIGRTLGNIGI